MADRPALTRPRGRLLLLLAGLAVAADEARAAPRAQGSGERGAGSGLEGAVAAQQAVATGSGLEVGVAYTAEVMANVRGGVKRGAVGLGNLDLTARLDLERLVGWSGTTVFLYGLVTHGGEPSTLTGDVQVVSNIEAPEGARIYEAWIEKNLAGPALSLLAGLYDVNSEFDVAEEAGLFLNSSFGVGAELGASGVNGPSIFPVTSLGVRAQWHPTRRLRVQAAVLDGVPGHPDDPGRAAVRLSSREGALWAAEVALVGGPGPTPAVAAPVAGGAGAPEVGRDHGHDAPPWRLAAGLWQYTGAMERVDGDGTVRGDPGAYLLAEARPGTGAEGGRRPLGLFARVGLADGRTNRFGAYVGAGVTYEGPLAARPDDVVGLGVASAHDGGPFERAAREAGLPVAGAETTLELTWRAAVGSRLELQPDVQWVLNPGTAPDLESALVLGLRGVVAF